MRHSAITFRSVEHRSDHTDELCQLVFIKPSYLEDGMEYAETVRGTEYSPWLIAMAIFDGFSQPFIPIHLSKSLDANAWYHGLRNRPKSLKVDLSDINSFLQLIQSGPDVALPMDAVYRKHRLIFLREIRRQLQCVHSVDNTWVFQTNKHPFKWQTMIIESEKQLRGMSVSVLFQSG